MWIDRFFEDEERDILWDGHRERLRGRMETRTFKSLKLHEQIEVILYPAVPQKDLGALARNLADKFKNVQNMIDADPEEFQNIPGMTPSILEWIMIYQELVLAYMDAEEDGHIEIFNLRDSIQYISQYRFKVRPPESWIVYLDFENQIALRKTISPSLSWGEPQYVRQMISDSTSIHARKAVVFLFVGTLPLEIGDYEREHLVSVSDALRVIGVELLDVIYVGESDYLSISRDPLMDLARADSLKMEFHEIYLREDPVEGDF